jgi:hypothetical protein
MIFFFLQMIRWVYDYLHDSIYGSSKSYQYDKGDKFMAFNTTIN